MLLNLLFLTHVLILLYQDGPLVNLRSELKDSIKNLEQNQSMHCIWVIFRHLFRGT